MKSNLGVIRALMLGLALVLSFAGQAKASGGGHVSGLEESADGYKVALTFKAGQVPVGHNPLTVRIHDAQGQPVGNATVTVVARKYTEAKKETAGHGSSGADVAKEDHAGPGKSVPKEAGGHGSSGASMAREDHAGPGKSAPKEAEAHGSSMDMAKEGQAGPGKSAPKKADAHVSSGMDMGKEGNAGQGPGEAALSGSPVAVALAAGHEIGEYTGEAETAEAGQWMIQVMFAVPQQERSVAFMVDVKKGGPNWPVLWGFLAVNVAIIAIAAMTRKKSVSSPIQEAAI